MTITKRLGITLTPLRLHAASTVRIPHSTNNFQNLLPTVRVTPLNLFSASTVNLHGAFKFNMFRNNHSKITVRQCMKLQIKIGFGQLKILVRCSVN